MDSEKVPYFILDLLQQVPSVYVPGLGRFEAIFHPAVIDLPGSKVHPPHIEPSFDFTQNDKSDLLPSYMHYVTGISKEEAEILITNFVLQVLDKTSADQTYAIEKFGSFSRTSTDIIHFTPDWDAFNLSFRGLETIDLQPAAVLKDASPEIAIPVKQESIIPVSDQLKTYEPDVVIQQETKDQVYDPVVAPAVHGISDKTSRLWWIILAIALFLITVLCAYLAWDILSNRKKLDPITSLDPDSSVTGNMDDVETIPDTTIKSQVIIYRDSIQEFPEDTPVAVPEETETPSTDPACFVVVGAFGNVDNVTRMISRLESMGYSYEKIEGGALTKVAIKTSCEKSSLQRILNEARANINPEAWVY